MTEIHPHIITEKSLEDFDGDCAAATKVVCPSGDKNSQRVVVHAIAIKPINKKINRSWLRRQPRKFLCTPPRSQRMGSAKGRIGAEITCKQCKSLIARYELSLCSDKELDKLIDSH